MVESGATWALKRIYGESEHQLDEKGRINVPKRFQPLFDGGGFLTRSFDESCLLFWGQDAWGDFQEKMSLMRFTDESADVVERWVSCGSEVTLDGQGRLSVPPLLRRYAGLSAEVTLVARGNKLEVWDTGRWAAYQAEKLSPDNIRAALRQLDQRLPGSV